MDQDTAVSALAQPGDMLRLLAVSDIIEPQLYNSGVSNWLAPISMIVSCGDLPATYLDFLMSALNAPCYHVIGNHCSAVHAPDRNSHCLPEAYPGVVDLNGRTMAAQGLLLAGVEGSPLYNGGPPPYTGGPNNRQLWRMVPLLLRNKSRYGRYLDILVSHAPPRGIHDETDVTHRGFKSFLWFLRTFHPRYMLHGHTHRYIKTLPYITQYEATTVVN